MTNKISFYKCRKSYEPVQVSRPLKDDDDGLELSNVGDGEIGIIKDFKPDFKIINPVFYASREKGVLRLNRTTFMDVNITGNDFARLRNFSTIEIFFTHSSNSLESFRAKVELLLRLPEFVVRHVSSNIDLGEMEREFRKEGKKRHHKPPRVIFEDWIRTHGGDIVFESADGYILAHDGHTLLIVSFFDGDDPSWLADEERVNGEPPQWFSESAHMESPLYKLGLAAKHFNSLGYGKVLPLTVISDHIEILNEEDITEEWEKMGMHVCYCHKTEDYIDTFEHFLESAAKEGGEFRVPSTEIMNELKKEGTRFEKEG